MGFEPSSRNSTLGSWIGRFSEVCLQMRCLLRLTGYQDFYRFVFQFSREGTHKTIGTCYRRSLHLTLMLDAAEREVIIALLPIVLDRSRAPHLDNFLRFLQQSSSNVITLDQWDSFLQFNHTVAPDFSDYDEDGACMCAAQRVFHSAFVYRRATFTG
jgi:hypothetical protein